MDGSNSLNKEVPRYVGIGTPGRHSHCLPSKKSHNKIVESHKTDHRWRVEVLEPVTSKEVALKWEMDTILKYGRIDKGTGTLFNQTDGGEGHRGADKSYMKTEEYKKAMSKAKSGQHVGSKNPMYGSKANLGKKYGPNPKISKAHKELWGNMSEEEREKRCEKLRGSNNPMFGRAPGNAIKITINGTTYRSIAMARKCLRESGLTFAEAQDLINKNKD